MVVELNQINTDFELQHTKTVVPGDQAARSSFSWLNIQEARTYVYRTLFFYIQEGS
jgi:hypothetical protein